VGGDKGLVVGIAVGKGKEPGTLSSIGVSFGLVTEKKHEKAKNKGMKWGS